LLEPVHLHLGADDTAQISPVREYIDEVNNRLQEAGVKNGKVKLDRKGRLTLKGEYENEAEVDKAFAIAQEMVGVQWVSPVTPSNIRVNSWAKCLGESLGSNISPECKLKLNRDRVFESDNKAPGRIANKYALIVGVGQFKNEGYNLKYANKDAHAIYDYLLDSRGGNIPQSNITLLTNEQATRSAIETELQNIKAKAKKDDLVLIYFSSHGAHPDKYGNAHIVVYDSILPEKNNSKGEQDRINLWNSSFRQEKLKEFVQTINAKRLAVILDTCYSGGVYHRFNEGSVQNDKRLIAFKKADIAYSTGQSTKALQENLLGAKDIFIEDSASNASIKQTPLSFRSDWGIILMSASGNNEKSWEPAETESNTLNITNSIFTHYLLQALQNTRGNINKAFSIAKPNTASWVRKYRAKSQTPQLLPYHENANIILGQ
jgi:hypothetical protein